MCPALARTSRGMPHPGWLVGFSHPKPGKAGYLFTKNKLSRVILHLINVKFVSSYEVLETCVRRVEKTASSSVKHLSKKKARGFGDNIYIDFPKNK